MDQSCTIDNSYFKKTFEEEFEIFNQHIFIIHLIKKMEFLSYQLHI